ncbi:MAG: nitroreductase family protein [Clostridia bacterium]|nr:nitroreductase family protein [Clostridia bacterium]
MNVNEAIIQRRSIRKYTGQVVEDDKIRTLLNSGFYAPTARNIRPLHFIVIKDKTVLEKIAHEQPNAKFAPDAGCGILVCGDKALDEEGYIVEDGSAAIQNILLSAYEMGLGTVWCGVYPREQRVESFTRLCGLPSNILPVGFVVVGYADETKEVPERFNADCVHWEKW